jgi:hypothetical protein
LQGLLIPVFTLVKLAQIAPGVRGRTTIADGLADGGRLIEHLGGEVGEGLIGVRKVCMQILVGQPNADQAVGLVVRVIEAPYLL